MKIANIQASLVRFFIARLYPYGRIKLIIGKEWINMPYQWYFAPSNGGQTSGLNDSGVSYFEADPIRSVAKETLQDSIDALHKNEKKTIIKFRTFNVSKTEVPNYEKLVQAFNNGIQRWNHHKATKSFFEKGLEMLNREEIPILAIQDYNTTGLPDVGNTRTGGWYTLILSAGVTEKAATDGGSYGIGKNAPFAASALRTVLYSTKNRDEQIGFQGIARIPTITNSDGEDTQGTGYYFNPHDQQPVMDDNDILPPYRRTEYGTDKFILGFNDEKEWEERLIDEVLSSYLLAIYRETLEVHVNDKVINKTSLPEMIKIVQQFNKESLALQYYEVLHSKHTQTFEKKFKTVDGDEEVAKLWLLERDGFQKRVGLHRSTGMKIFDKGHFRTPLDFSGIFIVEGEKLNAVLREMEPPTHDKWIPKLYKENTKYAEKLISDIYAWLNKCANSLLKQGVSENFQIKGIEELLPDLSDASVTTIEMKKDTLKDRISYIHPNKKKKKRRPKPSIPSPTGVEGEVPGADRKGKPKENPQTPKEKGTRAARVSRINVFCTNPDTKEYAVLITPQTTGTISFQIKAIGENGRTTDVKIAKAQFKGKEVPIKKNIVGPFTLDSKEVENLTLTLDTTNRLALEVVKV